MPKKEKKPKEKKEKKEKKGKKSKKDKEKHENKKAVDVTKRIAVCGDENSVRQVMDKSGKLKAVTSTGDVTMNVENGMNGAEVAAGGDYEGVLCVYDIREQKSYNFLKEKVMSAAKSKSPNAYLMVAAVGLEYRGSTERPLVPNQDLKSLAGANGAVCTELISYDPNAMADGILSLFIRKNPNSIMQDSNISPDEDETGDGKKKNKKDKKDKKEKKPKKEKKSKKKKQK
ncbi:unnamed protein product [Dibothriocephalus latus]|uniref:Uncharacterized protein n=1 Tax=Dibothriocephalus latus TaxID=60516 RepID=A0A3P6P8R9_DIBLA|nr:unnamed protein product [Dibothriocephalus latus]